MAGWSKTNYKNERFTAEIATEFVEAINERSALFGLSQFSAPTDKSKISAELWSSLQQRVIDLFPRFYPPQNYHKVDNAPAKYTSLQFWTDVYNQASYPVENFVTAVDSLPADYQDPKSAGFITRKVQAGDILGGWLLDHLQRAINLLVRPGIHVEPADACLQRFGYVYNHSADHAAALSAACAAATSQSYETWHIDGYANVERSSSADNWSAMVRTRRPFWRAGFVTIGASQTVAVDCFAQLFAGSNFCAYGQDLAQNKFCKIGGGNLTVANKVISGLDLDIAAGNAAINPAGSNAYSVGCYSSGTVFAIGQLDKPGGFKYY